MAEVRSESDEDGEDDAEDDVFLSRDFSEKQEREQEHGARVQESEECRYEESESRDHDEADVVGDVRQEETAESMGVKRFGKVFLVAPHPREEIYDGDDEYQSVQHAAQREKIRTRHMLLERIAREERRAGGDRLIGEEGGKGPGHAPSRLHRADDDDRDRHE